MVTREWRPDFPLDVGLTLGNLQRGRGDPTHRTCADGSIWRTARTPEGPATLRVTRRRDEVVVGEAWGAGRDWMLATMPDLLGASDAPAALADGHSVVTQAARRFAGLRLSRTHLVFDQVVPAILEQKVTGVEARRSWRELLWRFGEPAPGPAPESMRVVPDPRVWLEVADWEWHRCGVDATRRRTIRAAATVARRLSACAELSIVDAVRRLRVVPGIGAWTAAEVVQRAMGAPDEVSVGDFHLPSMVGWALVGRPLDDEGMLEELECYAGQRQRVVRLIEVGGPAMPRFGPRAPVRDYRAI